MPSAAPPDKPSPINPAFSSETPPAQDLAPTSREKLLTVSVVSHGHGAWLPGLLQALAATGGDAIDHVVVTHNLPGAVPPEVIAGLPFRLTQLTNAIPAGFGRNHNRAFALVQTPYFCVLNPDISLPQAGVWHDLLQAAAEPGVGCAFPTLLNTDGTVQDNARAVPTPLALFRRRLLGRTDPRVDWASGAFLVVPTVIYRGLDGFDERYFLYCEDTDFCLRLQVQGWRLVQGAAHAVHHAQRSSHRRWQHLAWHVQSLVRLWTSPALWSYLHRTSTKV